MYRLPVLYQTELPPKVEARLVEPLLPTYALLSYADPPLNKMNWLRDPVLPTTKSPLLLQTEPLPMIAITLFAARADEPPTVPPLLVTLPPDVIVRVFPGPEEPTTRLPPLVHTEPVPETNAMLALPLLPTVALPRLRTVPPLVMVSELPLQAGTKPRVMPLMLLQTEPVPVTNTLFEVPPK